MQRFDLNSPHGRAGLVRWAWRESLRHRNVLDKARILATTAFGSIRRKARFELGADLIGYSRGVLGMGEHVRMVARAMGAVGVPYGVVDYALGLGNRLQRPDADIPVAGAPSRRCAIMHVNADQMTRAYWYLGAEFFHGRRIVGYWAWELADCPMSWRPAIGMVDEIWAPSRFVQQAFSAHTVKPVVLMPLCVTIPNFIPLPHEAFGLVPEDFIFAFVFDCYSWVQRKNPLAAIRAFRKAFDQNEKVRLVLKAMNADRANPAWQALQAEVVGDPRITLIDETWSRERLLALLAICDAYVSLHRSEGFGRTPAEAMLLGKPVIATDYSGTQDFCRIDNSLLVDFRLVEVGVDEYPEGEGQVWADPKVAVAAAQMRRLFDDRGLAQRLGNAGRKTIESEFSAEAVGRRYAARLDETGMTH
jgi:glycosyltransferase involved in cell wall biosynthesis